MQTVILRKRGHSWLYRRRYICNQRPLYMISKLCGYFPFDASIVSLAPQVVVGNRIELDREKIVYMPYTRSCF